MVDVKGKRVYLSGPVTGVPDYNREAFAEAARRLREAGALSVFDPCEAWRDGDDEPFDWPHEGFMLVCLNRLTGWDWALDEGGCPRAAQSYDLLVSLPGWQGSEGARLERAVAESCGIRCAELVSRRLRAQGGGEHVREQRYDGMVMWPSST